MKVEIPYVLAIVKMDGADTLFTHQLRNYGGDTDAHQDGHEGQGGLHRR